MYQPMFKRPFKAILVGLILTLPACSTVKVQREVPSPELLRDCHMPVVSVRTNGQLAQAYQLTKDALVKCNIDKESLREWAKE